jgi:hypothetical protein
MNLKNKKEKIHISAIADMCIFKYEYFYKYTP